MRCQNGTANSWPSAILKSHFATSNQPHPIASTPTQTTTPTSPKTCAHVATGLARLTRCGCQLCIANVGLVVGGYIQDAIISLPLCHRKQLVISNFEVTFCNFKPSAPHRVHTNTTATIPTRPKTCAHVATGLARPSSYVADVGIIFGGYIQLAKQHTQLAIGLVMQFCGVKTVPQTVGHQQF